MPSPHRPPRSVPEPDVPERAEPTARADDGKPDDYEDGPSTAADLLDSNRHRDYVRGRRYEVWIESPFAKVKPDAMPSLRARYFVRWETREGDTGANGEPERWPVFATEEEWLELRVREEADALRSEIHAATSEQTAAADGIVAPFLTTAEVATMLGRSDDAPAVERELRRSKMVNSRGRGEERRWERDSVLRWIQDTTQRPGTAKDYFNPDY